MTALEKYKMAFIEAFEAEGEDVEKFVFKETEQWDSIGHMSLIAALEDTFSIELEPEEMLAINSYQKGKEILEAKGILFKED